MATQPPRTRTREEQRRLSIKTLAIASVASAAAAVVTSQFWIHGTWIAAAMTPVIVSVVSEILHRPTEAVARRVTTNRSAVTPREPEPGLEPVPDQITVYGGGRSRARSPSRRKKFAVGLVAATAVLGFAIAAVAITVPELITGQPIGKGNGGTTIFGGHKKSGEKQQTPDRQKTAPTDTQTDQQTTPTQPTQTNQRTTPTQPTTPQQPKQQTTPAQPPAQGQQQP